MPPAAVFYPHAAAHARPIPSHLYIHEGSGGYDDDDHDDDDDDDDHVSTQTPHDRETGRHVSTIQR